MKTNSQLLAALCVVSLVEIYGVNSACAVTRTTVTAIAESQVKDLKGFTQNPPISSDGLRDEDLPDSNQSGGRMDASASAPLDLLDSHATAKASANAQIGKLGVSVLASGVGAPKGRNITDAFGNTIFVGGGYASPATFASATWLDTLTLSSASRGNAIRAVYFVSIDGDLGASKSGPSAFAQVVFSVSNPINSILQIPNNIRAEAFKSSFTNIEEDVPGGFRVTVFPTVEPFTIGLTMILSGQGATADVSNSATWDGQAIGYFGEVGQSLTWGGLEGVFALDNGEELHDWTMSSESGFDYSKPFPVPEPSSGSLLTALLCSALAVTRRRT
jgi:hypothetical protein